jgi:hypothetical protein
VLIKTIAQRRLDSVQHAIDLFLGHRLVFVYQVIRVAHHHGGVLADGVVEQGLCKGRLIQLIVSKPSVTDKVDWRGANM